VYVIYFVHSVHCHHVVCHWLLLLRCVVNIIFITVSCYSLSVCLFAADFEIDLFDDEDLAWQTSAWLSDSLWQQMAALFSLVCLCNENKIIKVYCREKYTHSVTDETIHTVWQMAINVSVVYLVLNKLMSKTDVSYSLAFESVTVFAVVAVYLSLQ